jgi:hypothetical protein
MRGVVMALASSAASGSGQSIAGENGGENLSLDFV